MKLYVPALVAGSALIATVAIGATSQPTRTSSPTMVTNVSERTYSVTGTVVSARGGSLVVRIDDHGHRIPFSLGSGVSASDLRAGSRVSVRSHPSGETGQVADEVEVLSKPRGR